MPLRHRMHMLMSIPDVQRIASGLPLAITESFLRRPSGAAIF